MKRNFFLLIIFFLILEIKCKNNNKEEINKKVEEEEEEINNEELNEEESGGIMSDEVFEEKLQKILEEKRIRKNQKITKDKLKQIFDELYKRDFDLPDLPDLPEDSNGEIDIDPKDETKRFLNEIFNKLARGLDYDDEISISDIKEWISPKQVQVAVNEIIENLIGMMGNMGEGDL